MQRLFNAAALEGGYYNTAALEGGDYNTAALVGGSEFYDDAAVIGGFALAELASGDSQPGAGDLIKFGYRTMKSLPVTVQDTIQKMFQPASDDAKKKIYGALALLYVLDSLKAISIAPELDLEVRKMARQRWVLMQRYLQGLSDEMRTIYTRLLRYIHIPHHGPRACKRMKDRWLSTINSRNRAWGRSRAYGALPQMPSTVKYATDASWKGPYVGPPVTGKKRTRSATKKAPAKKKARTTTHYTGWTDPTDGITYPTKPAFAKKEDDELESIL